MSRVGKKPVIVPEGVTVRLEDPRDIIISGSKGELTFTYHREVKVVFDQKTKMLSVSQEGNTKLARSLWGTTARILENMIIGVSKGFEKKLELNGVGFRMSAQGKLLDLALGFSHPVKREIPEGLEAKVEGNTLTITGTDKQKVGQFAAEIRDLKPVEPYKGKGFKYSDEIVRRKEGKKAAGTTA